MTPLQNDNDWVRRELRLAFELKVIPVLVGGTSMPELGARLPADVAELTTRHAMVIRPGRRPEDQLFVAERLVKLGLEQVDQKGSQEQAARPLTRRSPRTTSRQCASVNLLGLRLTEGQAVPLSNVYVPMVTTTSGRTDKEAQTLEQIPLLLDRLGESSLYVSGDPGSGKSTFCRWVTWLACEGTCPSRIPWPKVTRGSLSGGRRELASQNYWDGDDRTCPDFTDSSACGRTAQTRAAEPALRRADDRLENANTASGNWRECGSLPFKVSWLPDVAEELLLRGGCGSGPSLRQPLRQLRPSSRLDPPFDRHANRLLLADHHDQLSAPRDTRIEEVPPEHHVVLHHHGYHDRWVF